MKASVLFASAAVALAGAHLVMPNTTSGDIDDIDSVIRPIIKHAPFIGPFKSINEVYATGLAKRQDEDAEVLEEGEEEEEEEDERKWPKYSEDHRIQGQAPDPPRPIIPPWRYDDKEAAGTGEIWWYLPEGLYYYTGAIARVDFYQSFPAKSLGCFVKYGEFDQWEKPCYYANVVWYPPWYDGMRVCDEGFLRSFISHVD